MDEARFAALIRPHLDTSNNPLLVCGWVAMWTLAEASV